MHCAAIEELHTFTLARQEVPLKNQPPTSHALEFSFLMATLELKTDRRHWGKLRQAKKEKRKEQTALTVRIPLL